MFLEQKHLEFKKQIQAFLDTEINPNAEEWNQPDGLPVAELFRRFGKAGLLGVSKPKEYGGRGEDYMMECVLTDTLSTSPVRGTGLIALITNMCTPALARFGSDALKQEFLAPTIAGEQSACVAVTEKEAGSDVANIQTTALEDGADLVINGTKMWAGNCVHADWVCLLAKTSEGHRHRNKSLICVPMSEKGISISEPFKKLGGNYYSSAYVTFDNVRVPKQNIIGEEGQGFTYQMLQFQEERLCIAVGALGALQQVIDQTLRFTQEREIFGKPILHNQYIHYRMAELQTELEMLKTFTWAAIKRYTEGGDATLHASMAKLKVGRLAREITDSCLQFWGGRGYLEDFPMAASFRDMRSLSIAGGSDETMLAIICKLMNILPKQ